MRPEILSDYLSHPLSLLFILKELSKNNSGSSSQKDILELSVTIPDASTAGHATILGTQSYVFWSWQSFLVSPAQHIFLDLIFYFASISEFVEHLLLLAHFTMSWAKLLFLGSAVVTMAAPSSTWTNSTGSIASSSTILGSGGIVLPPHTTSSTTSLSHSSTASSSGPRQTISDTSSTSLDIVTSTLTVPPTGFSTQMATNTQWSSNTWLTTSKDGHSTIVPVIVGCPGCGPIAAGAGIIIW